MHLTKLTSSKRQGFRGKPLHRYSEKKLKALTYMKQKSSFIIAAVSMVAFVAGNMIGSHGMYAFWKSVWGKYDDSLIAYTGTVSPIARVPDYDCWAKNAGGGEETNFSQVPEKCLVALPMYDVQSQRAGESTYYPIGYMGSYKDGGDGHGSHPGVDIRTPKGTPILSMANGIVTTVRNDAYGFGKYVVIRHPHMPDPRNPQKTTVLHSVYAHLDTQLVAEGDIVQKGQQIALSGNTGFATGFHLHFQVDHDKMADGTEVPWHPYWPFSGADARNAGLSLAQAIDAGLHQDVGYKTTISPLLYTQANFAPVKNEVVESAQSSSAARPLTAQERKQQDVARLLTLRDARAQKRLAMRAENPSSPQPIVSRETIVMAETNVLPAAASSSASSVSASVASVKSDQGEIHSIEIQHDRSFSGRDWETIKITLLDAAGNAIDGSALSRDIYLRTAYGEAEFRPEVLSPLDFHGGRAEVKMLPRGRRTIVITVQPYGALSEPMKYEGD